MRASVIVPTFDRARHLDSCLAGIARQTMSADEFEVLVVDNGSTDDTGDVIARWAAVRPGLRGVEAPIPGVSRARNVGIREARGDLLAFLDDDTIPEPGWLAALLHGYTLGCDVGAACGRAVLSTERPRPAWLGAITEGFFSAMDFGPEPRLLVVPPEVPWSLNLSLRADVARAVGGFPEDLGRFGTSLRSGEEFPLIHRIGDLGWRVAYEPEAVVTHAVPPERLRIQWLMRRAWAGGTTAPLVRAAVEPAFRAEPGRAAGRVAFRGWRELSRRLRGPSGTLDVLVGEAAHRVAGIGALWAELRLRAR